MSVLGPNDPRAITDPKVLEEARANTEKWNEFLGIKPMTAKQKKAKRELEDAILDLIGWEDPKP